MNTKVDFINEIKPNAVFRQDEKSGYYKAHYKGFLQAIGMGKTKEEAELNLLEIFITTLKERGEKIREQSLNSYYAG